MEKYKTHRYAFFIFGFLTYKIHFLWEIYESVGII